MDTKWKKINENWAYKYAIWLVFLAAVFTCSYFMGQILVGEYEEDISIESFFRDSVVENGATANAFYHAIEEIKSDFYSIPIGEIENSEQDCSKHFFYYAEGKDGKILSNASGDIDFFKNLKIHYMVDNFNAKKRDFHWVKTPGLDFNYGFAYFQNAYYNEQGDFDDDYYARAYKGKVIDKLYIGMKTEYYNELKENYEYSQNYILNRLPYLVISFILALISFILILFSAGRSRKTEGVYLFWIDRVYFLVFFIVIAAIVTLIPMFSYNVFRVVDNYVPFDYAMGFTVFAVIPVVLLIMVFITSMTRRIKAKVFFKYTVIGLLWDKIASLFSIVKDILISNYNKDSDSPKTKLLLKADVQYIVASFIITVLVITSIYDYGLFAAFLILLEFFITYLFLTYSIKIHQEIDTMDDERLQNMIKSERTKTELITGVSHDLKTPITSIVAYIDLIKKEEVDGKVKEYVDILDKKANSLSIMVKDLFELAKTASGEVVIEKEVIDVNKLVKQTLADMQDAIESYGFVIREKYADSELETISDGKKLYRVMQNLIDNALKYSLEGSRIFVETVKTKTVIQIVVKNTASYDMDFDSDEIIKKFVRADDSRTEEGSGLGLAISSTFVAALGGVFDIVVDGDQFKAIIILPIVKDNLKEEDNKPEEESFIVKDLQEVKHKLFKK